MGESQMKNVRDRFDYCIGDSIIVRAGTMDPDLNTPLGGWQGRISDVEVGEQGHVLLSICWDSITLENMHWAVIEQCEVRGMDWAEMVLGADQVDLATPRDTEQDVTSSLKRLSSTYAAHYLQEQGRQLWQSLSDVNSSNAMVTLNTWKVALEEKRMAFSHA
jgi:hypothetical protein